MKYLVTGANGFVGYNVLKELESNGHSIIAVVRDESSNIEKIKHIHNLRIIKCDMNTYDLLPSIINDRDIDCCIHLAWEGANGKMRGDSIVQINNVRNTLILCTSLKKMNVKRFVGVGTLAEKDADYYNRRDGIIPNLVSNYGSAKIAAHYLSKADCSQNGIEHVWCQLSNIYGAGDYTNNFINFACKVFINGERPAFTSGEQVYDFVHVKDAAKGVCLASKLGKANYTYFVGSGHARQLRDYIVEIRDIISPNEMILFGEIPFNGVSLPMDEFSCSSLFTDTGYRPNVSFDDGIRETIEWLKGNK